MRDISDPKTVRRLTRESEIRDREHGEVVAHIMGTIQGRSWVWEQLTLCNVFGSVFATSSMTMAFNEGNRNAGLRILADIMRYCPDQYTLMAREANGRSSTSEQRDRTSNGRDVEGPVTDDNGEFDNDADGGRETALSGLVNYEAEQRSIDRAKST